MALDIAQLGPRIRRMCGGKPPRSARLLWRELPARSTARTRRGQRGGHQPVKCKRIAAHPNALRGRSPASVSTYTTARSVSCSKSRMTNGQVVRVCACTVGHDLDGGLPAERSRPTGATARASRWRCRRRGECRPHRLRPRARPGYGGPGSPPGQADFNQALEVIGVQLHRPFLKTSRRSPRSGAARVRRRARSSGSRRIQFPARCKPGMGSAAHRGTSATCRAWRGQLVQAVVLGVGDAVELERYPHVRGWGRSDAEKVEVHASSWRVTSSPVMPLASRRRWSSIAQSVQLRLLVIKQWLAACRAPLTR